MSNQHTADHLLGLLVKLQKLMLQQSNLSHEDKVASMLQFSALTSIADREGITNSELAESLRLSPSSATQLVERLARGGFIERFADRDDRRITRLKMTTRGTKELHKKKQHITAKMKRFLSVISPADQQHLVRIYTKFLQKLENK